MKLLSITPLDNGTILGIRPSSTMTFRLHGSERARWVGWTFHLRGPDVIIETPAGWQQGTQARDGTERTVCVIPRSRCYVELRLAENETFDAATKLTETIAAEIVKPPPGLMAGSPGTEPPAIDAPAVDDEDDGRPAQYRKVKKQ